MWLKKKSDPHLVLTKAFERVRVDGLPCLLITSEMTNLSSDSYYVRALLVFLVNFHMTLKAIFSGRARVVVFREFSLPAVFFISPLLFILKKRLLFNINHNLKNQRASRSFFFKILTRMGFKFLLFDGRKVLPYLSKSLSSAIYTPPFPLTGDTSPLKKISACKPGLLKVGIVGDFRREKGGIEALLASINVLQSVQGVQIRVGARVPGDVVSIMPSCIMIIDTASEKSFLRFLDELDFIVILATDEGYFFRHSGTLVEAVLHRVIPIVPDYPVFAEQISWPKQIGKTYTDIEALRLALEFAKSNLPELRSNFEEYFSARNFVSFSIDSKWTR